ncbi:leucine-rich repeat protein [Bacteroides caecicola]|uniref:Leucine-rich repeat protein n=1 Tax=Bacteroides caecicola TaxID=1462569 RepID=A0ABS2F8N3_9BACE|nr:leucine-rich repeat protein [Bacteroides caecicola]MBM6806622.1 leucine-rich repeat protein [Bacteroides caecicola]
MCGRIISNVDFCYKYLPIFILEDEFLTIGSRSRLIEKLSFPFTYFDFSLLKMKKFFRGEHFYILFELQSQEYERVEFRAAVVNNDYSVPLLYVAEYHCDGTVKVSFIKLMRTPGSVKRIIELDKNNIVINERFTTEIDETDYEAINVEDVGNIDTEDSFLEMIRKYYDFHRMMLYDIPFLDVKCELYHIDYRQYINVGLDDDNVCDETETDEEIKADFYQKNEDGVEIGYFFVYEKPDILEGFNIMPATELRVEEYGIKSKIKTGKVMVACVKDYLHGEYISIPSVVEYNGRSYTVIGLDIDCFNRCKAKEIRLAETIDYIGRSSFSDCENLECIRMPSTIKFMGREAFMGCQNLKELEIPEGLEFSIHCISAFNHLEKVYVHNSLSQEDIELLSEDFNKYGMHKFEVINIDKY